jgi:tRNA modification GTPase
MQGPDAWKWARLLFRPRSGQPLPETPNAGQFWLGVFGQDLADEGILATHGGERVEFHTHGSPEVVRLLLEQLQTAGARICSWTSFLGITASCSTQALAVCCLSLATTARTASILLDQWHGAYATARNAAKVAEEQGDILQAISLLRHLAQWSNLGRHLTLPWRVVIAGAPNVGKSSLVNAIAGYQRCVVSPLPGTTRDVVATQLSIEGWPVELIDTAGLRDESEALERQGMERARQAMDGADLVLWVLDGSTLPVWPEDRETVRHRIIVNKIDLPRAWDTNERGVDALVSSQTGAGLAEFCTNLARWLVPEVPPPGAPIPFTSELVEEVELSLRRLEQQETRVP